MHSHLRPFLFFFTFGLMLAGTLLAQTNRTTGDINGRVVDPSGEALPGVTVTAVNTGTGLTRVAASDQQGLYTIALLPPGTYNVMAELAGLGQTRRDNVVVRLGTATNVRLTLSPTVAEEIVVTAEAPVIDVTEAGATSSVSEQQIENLPILGRDFKDLVLLTPGVTEAFGGRVALNGARGIATDYNIDGAEANSEFFGEERGGTEAPFVFSQAAIKEFQVIRSTYSAEYSRGVGATMNAITKSGTNNLDGQLFWFLRDGGWADERSTTVDGQPVGDFFVSKDVDQFGFALGGPIVRDRYHYFLNADFQDVSEPLSIFDFREDSDFRALDAAVQAAFVSKIESILGYPVDNEFDLATKEDQETYLLKFDGNFGTSHHGSVRWNYADFNNFPSEGLELRSANGDEHNETNSLVIQAESVILSDMFNQFIFQYGLEERPIDSLSTVGVPNTEIDGGGIFVEFGRSEFLPNRTDEEKFQIKDSLTWVRRSHQFKAGFEYIDAQIDNFFPREAGGEYDFDSVQEFLDNDPTLFFQGFGPTNGLNSWDFVQWGVFIQDTWNPRPNLTFDYGIRYDIQEIPKPVSNKFPEHPEFVTNFQDDDDNFAPRLGFAWDVKGDGRSVLRGGVGRFYNFLPNILFAGPLAEVAGIYNRISVSCSSGRCPTYPNILTPEQFAEFVRASPDVTGVNSNLEAMESNRLSLGYEQILGSNYSVGIEGVYATLDKAQRLVNVNAGDTGRRYGDLVVYSTSIDALQRYPEFRDVKLHSSDAEGDYKSITLQTRRIPTAGSKFSWLAHYTWAEAIDQDSNERSTSTPFHVDPFRPEVSEGPADYDIEHRILISGTYELPWSINLSGILNWRTGAPYTAGINTGSTALNGLFGLGVRIPVFRDSSGNVIDMTQATGMTRDELSAFLQGATMEGRNRRRQPDFMNIDLRLSKRFVLPGQFGIEIIGEVFNILNEENRVVPFSNQTMFNGFFRSGRWNFSRNSSFESETSFSGLPRQYQVAAKLLF